MLVAVVATQAWAALPDKLGVRGGHVWLPGGAGNAGPARSAHVADRNCPLSEEIRWPALHVVHHPPTHHHQELSLLAGKVVEGAGWLLLGEKSHPAMLLLGFLVSLPTGHRA